MHEFVDLKAMRRRTDEIAGFYRLSLQTNEFVQRQLENAFAQAIEQNRHLEKMIADNRRLSRLVTKTIQMNSQQLADVLYTIDRMDEYEREDRILDDDETDDFES